MAILLNEMAKAELKRLKKLDKSKLWKSSNASFGYYRKEPYLWIAFDNRKGKKLISHWQQEIDCTRWLYMDNYNHVAPVYCWHENW